MPYISKEQRQQGAWAQPEVSRESGRDWSIPTDAATLRSRRLPGPDQSRYGTATTDPLGREGPGWHTGKNGLPVKSKGDRET